MGEVNPPAHGSEETMKTSEIALPFSGLRHIGLQPRSHGSNKKITATSVEASRIPRKSPREYIKVLTIHKECWWKAELDSTMAICVRNLSDTDATQFVTPRETGLLEHLSIN